MENIGTIVKSNIIHTTNDGSPYYIAVLSSLDGGPVISGNSISIVKGKFIKAYKAYQWIQWAIFWNNNPNANEEYRVAKLKELFNYQIEFNVFDFEEPDVTEIM